MVCPDVSRAVQSPSIKQFLSDYMRMSLTELRGEICQSQDRSSLQAARNQTPMLRTVL